MPMAQPPGSETLRLAHAREQRAEDPEARPHLRDEFVGSSGVDDVGRRDFQRLALIGAVARALAVRHDVDAVIIEDALQERDVGKARHVVEDERLLGQEARDHQGQSGVLGARNRNGAIERPAADDADTIHVTPALVETGLPRPGRPDAGDERKLSRFAIALIVRPGLSLVGVATPAVHLAPAPGARRNRRGRGRTPLPFTSTACPRQIRRNRGSPPLPRPFPRCLRLAPIGLARAHRLPGAGAFEPCAARDSPAVPLRAAPGPPRSADGSCR